MIGGRIVELGRFAVAAIVERDDTPAGAGQCRDPAGMNPIGRGVRRKAMHQDDRLPLAFIQEGKLDIAVMETLHGHRSFRPGQAVRARSGAG